MGRSKWTPEELAILPHAGTYEDFRRMVRTDKSFDAWEVKRRRLYVPADIVAAKELEDEAKNGEKRAKEIGEALDGPLIAAIGEVSEWPSYYGPEILFIDFECTHLKANFGWMLCASMMDQHGNVETIRIDDTKRRSLRDDRALVMAVRDRIEQADMWVTWNGKGFDLPFLDTRLLIHDQEPVRKDRIHADAMYKARRFSLQIHSSRLDAVAKTFRFPVQKTSLDPDLWMDAQMGDRAAMDYIVEHCEHDVQVLGMAYRKFRRLFRTYHR